MLLFFFLRSVTWVTGAATFHLLKKRVEGQRKERMRIRRQKLKERKQRKEALKTQNLAESQVQTIGHGSS